MSTEFNEIIRKEYTILLYSFYIKKQLTNLLFNVFTFKVDIKKYFLFFN